MDIARLVELNAVYARVIDNEQFEEWPKLFHDPCLYKVTTAENVARGPGGRPDLRRHARHAGGPHLLAAQGQHLRAAALPPHRRPAGRAGPGQWRGGCRDAVPDRAHHARGRDGCVRHRLLPRQGEARRGRARCASPSASWCATAGASTRWSPSRSELPTVSQPAWETDSARPPGFHAIVPTIRATPPGQAFDFSRFECAPRLKIT